MNQRKKRVLVVDDDEAILSSVQVALEGRGYEVLIARDGAEALARAERDRPDVILLDVILPKRSGFNVLDHLDRARFRSPPIIVLSASDEPRCREFAADHGADAFVPKPFEIGDLLERVDCLTQA